MRLAALLPALILAAAPLAAQDMRTETVRFAPGATGTVISDRITGRDSVVYEVGAEAGQRMRIRMTTDNGAAYFNVYEPGRGPGDQALAVSEQTGPMTPDLNVFDGVLPTSGVYSVSVYLYRSAARRGERANYTLDLSITGDTGATVGADYADGLQGGPDYWEVTGVTSALNIRTAPSASATVAGQVRRREVLRNGGCRMAEGRRWCQVETLGRPRIVGWAAGEYLRESAYQGGGTATELPETPPSGGTAERAGRGDFDATGPIRCRQRVSQAMRDCPMGVARAPGGEATVVVTRPDGSKRTLFFQGGAFLSADTSQADGYPAYSATRGADGFVVQVGEERYEIFDAVVFGG
jgi:hypothetical protein